ncbi:hypothetical protein ACJD0Z_17940 [Flavobacteriaceae bacterium M23B6Z8]
MRDQLVLQNIKAFLTRELDKHPGSAKRVVLNSQIRLVDALVNDGSFQIHDKEVIYNIISSPYTSAGFGNLLFDAILLLHCSTEGTENELFLDVFLNRVFVNPFTETLSIIENESIYIKGELPTSYLNLIKFLNLSWKNKHVETLLSRFKSSEDKVYDDLLTVLKNDSDITGVDLNRYAGVLLYALYLRKQEFPKLNVSKEQIIQALMMRNYRISFEILGFLINKKEISNLLLRLYEGVSSNEKHIFLLEHIFTEYQTVLSEHLNTILSDVYAYETRKLKLLSVPRLFNLNEIEQELDSYKMALFDEFSLQITDEFVVSPLVESSVTQFKWHFDAGQDYEAHSYITNIVNLEHEPVMLHTVISTLSSNGYFEYEVNKYQQLIFNLFSEPKTLLTAFQHFFEKIDDSENNRERNTELEQMVITEFMKLTRVLIDRNTIIPKAIAVTIRKALRSAVL